MASNERATVEKAAANAEASDPEYSEGQENGGQLSLQVWLNINDKCYIDQIVSGVSWCVWLVCTMVPIK